MNHVVSVVAAPTNYDDSAPPNVRRRTSIAGKCSLVLRAQQGLNCFQANVMPGGLRVCR